jgi:hypothetical protein
MVNGRLPAATTPTPAKIGIRPGLAALHWNQNVDEIRITQILRKNAVHLS